MKGVNLNHSEPRMIKIEPASGVPKLLARVVFEETAMRGIIPYD
jgi:hypothetical protein